MLNYLELGVCGINLKPEYNFIGSALRGTFGYGLRRASCPYIEGTCTQCYFMDSCIYREFFENVSDTPNFRLDFELDQKSFDFKILLFGHATAYLPHVCIAIQNMQEIGLGVSRHEFKISNFTLNNKATTPEILLSSKPYTLNFTPSFTAGDYEICLQTPLRIKQKNVLVRRNLDFKSFIRQIAMRFENIALQKMDKFEVKFERFEQDLYFYDLERYSNRQQTKMPFGGLLGCMRVLGLDARSAELLELVQITGAGKSVAFGLGKIKVQRI